MKHPIGGHQISKGWIRPYEIQGGLTTPDQSLDLLPDLSAKAGSYLAEPTGNSQIVSLPGPVAFETPVPAQFPADSGFVAPQQVGNLRLTTIFFLQNVNLVSFLSGKLRVASHLCSSYLLVRKATMLPQLAF